VLESEFKVAFALKLQACKTKPMSYTLATYLFSKPSAITGAARLLDFWGQFDAYNRSSTPMEADAKALYADWRTVGEQLWEAYESIGEQEINGEPSIERTSAF